MKGRIFLALALLCLTVWPAVAAEDAPLAEVVRALETPFSRSGKGTIRDFQADFRQQSQLVSLDRTQEGAGRVFVRFGAEGLPGFRWEYERPEPQVIVSDGRTVWVYLPANRQVIVSEVDPAAKADDPLLFLTGLGNLSREFTIAPAEPYRDAAGNYRLELLPRRPSPYIERLLITVPREAVAGGGKQGPTFPLLATQVVDPAGNITRIEFRQVKVNLGLKPERFRFEVPEGVEVVRGFGE